MLQFTIAQHITKDACRQRGARTIYKELRISGLFVTLPELGHIFEGLALGLRNEFPYKESCKDADDSVKTVCEGVTEVLSHRAEAHVVHREEGRRYDEVEDPLEGYSYSYSSSTDGVREDL